MGTVLIIGTGAAGSVTAQKCCMLPKTFSKVILANRTISKADKLKKTIIQSISGHPPVEVAQVDADNPRMVSQLIRKFQPEMVINMALPYQDLSIMEACIETGVNYVDTANYESPEDPKFSYKRQWEMHDRFKIKGKMALLGSGFDPGVTNIYIAHAKKNYFDEIDEVDIVDANGGDHGQHFATNFNPEINIREVTADGRYYEDGIWKSIPALSVHKPFDFPAVGVKEMYLMYHEELESLTRNLPEIKTLRFWMTFSEKYLTYLRVLENIGMTKIEPVEFEGNKIVPLKFLKALLPEPSSLGISTKGKVCIGCLIKGKKDDKEKTLFVYCVKDHEDCYREVGSQAIAYTTGVPAMIGAKLVMENTWFEKGVYNVEQLDPTPFMNDLTKYGLPWTEKFI